MQQELVHLGNGAHALATLMLGSRHDAADAVHDAFATVLSRPEAYDASKGCLKTWFLRGVRNRCIDLIRQRRTTDAELGELIDPAAGPEQTFEITERDESLRQALRQRIGSARLSAIGEDHWRDNERFDGSNQQKRWLDTPDRRFANGRWCGAFWLYYDSGRNAPVDQVHGVGDLRGSGNIALLCVAPTIDRTQNRQIQRRGDLK